MKQKRYEDYTNEELRNMERYNYLEYVDLKTSYVARKTTRVGIIVFLIVFLIITIFKSITTVPTGYVGVKTRFGQVQNTMIQEGLNIKVPYVEKIVKIDCRTKKLETTSEGSTRDLQTVNISIAVNYNVNKDTANKLYKEVGIDYENIIINPSILESIKSVAAQYTAEELITKRADVSAKIQEAISNKILDRGFTINGFNITNIAFSDAYNQAIETKAVKQQEVETSKAELEKQKIQNEKEISVAEKDAKVMELQNAQITENTLRLKELEIKQQMINKWSGNFPSTMLNDNVGTLFDVEN